MIKKWLLVFVFSAAIAVFTLPAQAQGGAYVVCPDGQVIENGVEIVVNMRSGFTYTATAIGLNGFDPVLAISDNAGNYLCADDTREAASYSANLPTTGQVAASTLSAQMPFFHNFNGFADITLTVGGFGNTSGEFLVVLEGMAVTANDGSGPSSGDPFTLYITPNVTASGVPISAYMLSVTTDLDPLMKIMDDNDQPVQFEDGSYFACDDAGTLDLCWGESYSLVGSYVSRSGGRQLGGGELDAMMIIPLETLGMAPDEEGYLIWKMTSSGNQTYGDYMVAFHLGTAAPDATAPGSSSSSGGVMDDSGRLRQWASSASGSSQYTASGWSFAQATGAPDTDACGDINTAWASATATGSDTLTLNFDEAVIPTQINIYQTYNPGSIVKVQVANRSGGVPITLADSADPPGNTPCPGIFTIDIDNVEQAVDQVIIHLDQSIGGNWNEIDAVELVGFPPGDADV
jgi:hypothetical protein